MPFINRVGTKVVETIEGGGGNAALAFSVKNYSTLPETGTENEIAVISDAMSGWVMQAEEPTHAEGLVWIRISNASDVAFSAVEDNVVMVYPVGVSQSVDGSWVNREAFIYQNGWKQFSREKLEIFTDGVINTSVTDIVYDAHGGSSLDGTRLKIRITAADREGFAGTSSKIDVSSYKTLCVQVTCGSIATSCTFGLKSTHIPSDGSAGWIGSYAASKSLSMTANTQYTDSLAIDSFNDDYYICVSTYTASLSVYVNKIWLE